MQCSGDVSLRARVRKRGRNLKPAKDANRFTVGGGNQVLMNPLMIFIKIIKLR